MPDNIVEISGINKAFGNKQVVKNVSFSVKQGEIMGLVGPNGAGKTTIIRMIMGIIKPDGGVVSYNFNGQYYKSAPQNKTGYMPEERGLVKEVKVLDLITYLGSLKGLTRKEAQKKALEQLELMELQDYAYKKVETLSKGMKQKLQLIMTYLHDPQLLILDEPLSGLDPVNQELFRDMIFDFAQKGKTILLSSHQMSLIEDICERVFMINRGECVLYGDLLTIKEQHADPFIELLVMKGKDILQSKYPQAQEFRKDWLRMQLEENSLQEFIAKLPSEIVVAEMHMEQSSLHQIFLKLMREGKIDGKNA